MLGVITLDLCAVILGGVFALLPVFAHDVFGTDSWGSACFAPRRAPAR